MQAKARVVFAARGLALATIGGVGGAAFRLSYATLEDLAKLAHIPADDAWLFPVIVDGTIVQATVSALVVAPGSRKRRWFNWVLIVGAFVSVAGNSFHAVTAGHGLPGWACAVVAAIAPIALLVDTHGVAVLFRAAQRHSVPVTDPVPVVEGKVSKQPVPLPEPVSDPEPLPEPLPVPQPYPVVPVVRSTIPPAAMPVRPARPVQQMLPIAVVAGGMS